MNVIFSSIVTNIIWSSCREMHLRREGWEFEAGRVVPQWLGPAKRGRTSKALRGFAGHFFQVITVSTVSIFFQPSRKFIWTDFFRHFVGPVFIRVAYGYGCFELCRCSSEVGVELGLALLSHYRIDCSLVVVEKEFDWDFAFEKCPSMRLKYHWVALFSSKGENVLEIRMPVLSHFRSGPVW